jgi:hypothetical protein
MLTSSVNVNSMIPFSPIVLPSGLPPRAVTPPIRQQSPNQRRLSSLPRQEPRQIRVDVIPNEPDVYKETEHGFIVRYNGENGNIEVIAIEQNGVRRPLTENERIIARNMELVVV